MEPFNLELQLSARNDAGVFAGEGADLDRAIELLELARTPSSPLARRSPHATRTKAAGIRP